MALRTLVKVNSINNLSHARFCAGIGVEFLGFNLCPGHEGFLSVQKFVELTGWLAGIKIVGEFFDAKPADILETVKSQELDYLETTQLDSLDELNQLQIPLILRLTLNSRTQPPGLAKTMNQTSQKVDYFLIDGDLNKRSPTVTELAQLGASHPLLLGAGITAQSVHHLLDQSPIAGIALSGGSEIKPGYYDFDQMAEILESIETD